ncbi:hypothetical protein ACP4OV_007209 [Aristida adscensionis]
MVLQPGLDNEHEPDGDELKVDDGMQSVSSQPGLTDEEDEMHGDPDDNDLKAEDVGTFIEGLGPMEHGERLTLMKESLGIPSESCCHINFYSLPECTRDRRHVGVRTWHRYSRMPALPAMRYTNCNAQVGKPCFHEPTPVRDGPTCGPVEVYGFVAVRDGEDYCRNYLFNRPRATPLDISLTDSYIRLMSPRRGMSMKFNCLIEVDIRIKEIGDEADDKTLVDGGMELIEDQISFQKLFRCTMSGPYGSAVFDMILFQFGVEATIHLDFLEVPKDGLNIQMFGYTTIARNMYAFIDKNCECNGFVISTGRFPQYFVVVIHAKDNFLIDFAEGKAPLTFKPNIHGIEEKEYYFCNGAIVSVKFYWSTTFY